MFVQRISPIFILEGKNFIASTANIRVDVEQIETRYGTDVKKDANVGSKNETGRVKDQYLWWGLINDR